MVKFDYVSFVVVLAHLSLSFVRHVIFVRLQGIRAHNSSLNILISFRSALLRFSPHFFFFFILIKSYYKVVIVCKHWIRFTCGISFVFAHMHCTHTQTLRCRPLSTANLIKIYRFMLTEIRNNLFVTQNVMRTLSVNLWCSQRRLFSLMKFSIIKWIVSF